MQTKQETPTLRDAWKPWINKAYIDWRGNSRNSIADFSRFLDVPQQVMNGWLNYGAIPSAKYLNLIGIKLPKVYDVLGFPRPADPIDDLLALVPEETRRLILQVRTEYSAELASKGIETDSPEARQIVKNAFDRYGLKVTIN